MGYNLKTPWDLAELKKEAIPVIAPIVGSSSFGVHRDCFVDLKLGRFGDPGEGLAEKLKAPQVSVMEPSSSRKARARSHMAQAASCLVDGCRSDLSTCRDYHRRHKVCEAHSKTAIVTIGGQERRFCQQCSRFHSLVEFDEGKRSCRKRLDGHNRRRRKPQPEPITLNPARFLSNHQGARYLPFSDQQACAASSPYSSVWAGVMKTENDPILDSNTNSHSFISFADRKNSFPGGLYGGKQLSFLQGTTTSILPGDSTGQAFHDPTARGNQKMFVDGLDRIISSDRAFSLLSSPPSKSREFGFGNVAQTSSSQSPHSFTSSNHDNNLRPQDKPAASNVMESEGTLPSGIDGSAGMPHQTLFFSWE